jgi:hypothetical protein
VAAKGDIAVTSFALILKPNRAIGLEQAVIRGQHGGDRKSEGFKDQGNNYNLETTRYSC